MQNNILYFIYNEIYIFRKSIFECEITIHLSPYDLSEGFVLQDIISKRNIFNIVNTCEIIA